VKRSTPLILLAGLGLAACNLPTAPQTSQTSAPEICDSIGGESIFGYVPPCRHSGPPPSPQVALTDTVSPGVVRAGDKFTATASAGFFCGGQVGGISVTYANKQYAQDFGGAFGSLTESLIAVLGDTVVTFQANCPGAVATRSVIIQVLPAQ
jgi:hypothetical protein